MQNKKIKVIVLIGLYTALAVCLDFLKAFLPFLDMPMGGSINIATIPIVIASFHLGIFNSFIVGLLWYVLTSIFGLNYPPISVLECLFDYLIPSTIFCISSIFYKRKKSLLNIELGILLSNLIRIVSILIAGAYFWFPESSAAGSLAAWLNSLTYNLPYLIATMVMLMIIVPIIIKRRENYFNNL